MFYVFMFYTAAMRGTFPLAAFLLAASSTSLFAAAPATQPYKPISWTHEQRHDPDMSVYVATIDLTDPSVHIRVSPGGADPDGKGEWQTTLMTVKQIAEREKFELAINASFFAVNRPASQPIAEEQAEKSGKPGSVTTQQSGYRVTRAAHHRCRPLGRRRSQGQDRETQKRPAERAAACHR